MWKQLCAGGRGTALCQEKLGQLCHFLAGDFVPRCLCPKNGGDHNDSAGESGVNEIQVQSPQVHPACGKYSSCFLGALREELGEHANPGGPVVWLTVTS